MRIVILAGGEGRRIGGGKPQRLLGGETLLDRALRRARSWSDEVLVAAREGGDLRDDPAIEGPLGGVAAALALGGDVLTIPCDMPFLPDDLPAATWSSDEAATLAASGGRLHPVCALWRRTRGRRCRPISPRAAARCTGFAEAVGLCGGRMAGRARSTPSSISTTQADLARAEALLRSR